MYVVYRMSYKQMMLQVTFGTMGNVRLNTNSACLDDIVMDWCQMDKHTLTLPNSSYSRIQEVLERI